MPIIFPRGGSLNRGLCTTPINKDERQEIVLMHQGIFTVKRSCPTKKNESVLNLYSILIIRAVLMIDGLFTVECNFSSKYYVFVV